MIAKSELVLEALARAEDRRLLRGDFNGLARARLVADARSALLDLERAEADQLNLFAFLEGLENRIGKRVRRSFRLLLVQTGLFCNLCNQGRLIYVPQLLL